MNDTNSVFTDVDDNINNNDNVRSESKAKDESRTRFFDSLLVGYLDSQMMDR
ncbi:MAG: hypothetical protein WCR56_05865 [Bacilli bacterium]|jgi:hypothetical protein